MIQIGEHVGAGGAPCYADLNELLGKHTAILGSTGAGKSAAVAAIIHSMIEHGRDKTYGKWKPQVVILDPHNEYGKAFKGHKRLSTDEETLSLPYWLLDLDETNWTSNREDRVCGDIAGKHRKKRFTVGPVQRRGRGTRT